MAAVNKAILIGNLGSDPEVRTTATGQKVANFTIATNEPWTNKDGEKVDRVEWHRIVAWGRLAEIAGEYLKKGRQVYIEGRLQTRQWEDKDGIKRYTTEIVVQNMQMLGKKDDDAVKVVDDLRDVKGAVQETVPPSDDDAPTDDVPF